MSIQKIPKKYRRPEWHGQQWGVTVFDGNGEEWLTYFPGAGSPYAGPYMGGTATYMGIENRTPEQEQAIIAALEQTLARARELMRRGPPAKIIPLRPDEEGKP